MVVSARRGRITLIIAAASVFILYYLYSSADDLSQYSQPFTPSTPPSPPQPFAKTPNDGSVRWQKLPDKFPLASLTPLPTGTPKSIPLIQAPATQEDAATKAERLRRQEAVKEAFKHSWTGYKTYAWMADEVTPVSRQPRNSFGGWAATLVDSMDTLWLMGLKEDFEECVAAIEDIDFTKTETTEINVFETTIRYMGGFLAAYDLTEGKYPILLTKAIEVGEILMSAFDTPNRMPITRWDWKEYVSGKTQETPHWELVAEPGSLSLEFTRLSQLTGDPKYYDATQRIADAFAESQMNTTLPGMWPVVFNPRDLKFDDFTYTLGGMSDSLYEYLPKQYLILGGLLEQPKKMYENFIGTAEKYLFRRTYNPQNQKLVISGDATVVNGDISFVPRGQHLTCFTGGMVAIAARIFNRPEDLDTAAAITDGCVWTYDSMKDSTGVGPEIFNFVPCSEDLDAECLWDQSKWPEHLSPPGMTSIPDTKYILRPEAIESVFILYRVTGDRSWQDKAWRMFEAVDRISRTSIAASGIHDVTNQDSHQNDNMESFWLGETLKYFYLVFSEPDLMSLDKYVLNTEAHPLRRLGA